MVGGKAGRVDGGGGVHDPPSTHWRNLVLVGRQYRRPGQSGWAAIQSQCIVASSSGSRRPIWVHACVSAVSDSPAASQRFCAAAITHERVVRRRLDTRLDLIEGHVRQRQARLVGGDAHGVVRRGVRVLTPGNEQRHHCQRHRCGSAHDSISAPDTLYLNSGYSSTGYTSTGRPMHPVRLPFADATRRGPGGTPRGHGRVRVGFLRRSGGDGRSSAPTTASPSTVSSTTVPATTAPSSTDPSTTVRQHRSVQHRSVDHRSSDDRSADGRTGNDTAALPAADDRAAQRTIRCGRSCSPVRRCSTIRCSPERSTTRPRRAMTSGSPTATRVPRRRSVWRAAACTR